MAKSGPWSRFLSPKQIFKLAGPIQPIPEGPIQRLPTASSATTAGGEKEQLNKVTGRTKYFSHNWCELTSNKFVLSLVKGIELRFVSPLTPSHPRPFDFSAEEMLLVDKEVDDLIKKGAVIQVSPCADQFISNIFLRPKKNGKLRPIINLKGLNLHLEKFILKWNTYHPFYHSFHQELG